VDSILIDEARTPLIISGPAEKSSDWYYRINAVIPFLKREQDFLVDEKSHTVGLTDSGVDRVENRLKIHNLYDVDNIEVLHHLHQALKAHALFKRDAQYVVENSQVVIVDEFTGRKMPGRRWSDGLHQAVEAKEGVKIEQENETLATVTFQNFFRIYNRLSGMTGTADTEATELSEIYDLEVRVIPTNKPVIRDDLNDLIYKTENEKWDAVADEIAEANGKGAPVLVGTTSVEKSEYLGSLLERRNITHSVLNAKFHQMEAEIVSQAGRAGSVTIATNMAGRGTDIVLGGNPESMAAHEVGAEEGPQFDAALVRFQKQCSEERLRVLDSGGLFILGTERHESRRIDNQLRGRAGRQGDPGMSRFYLSLDDDLMRVFGGDRVKKMMETLRMPDGEPIEHSWINKSVENAQRKIEGRNYDIRKNVLEYDDVMNLQRKAVYGLRDEILTGSLVAEKVNEAIEGVVYRFCDQYMPEGVAPDEWDLDGLKLALKNHFTAEVVLEGGTHSDFELAKEDVTAQVVTAYADRENEVLDALVRAAEAQGAEVARDAIRERWRFFERERYLRGIDSLWKHHLKVMESLRQGVHLEAYGQKDPKLVYKKQGYELFQMMFDKVEENVTHVLFRAEGPSEAEIEEMRQKRLEDEQKMMMGRGSDGSEKEPQRQKVVHDGGTYTRR
ncbi:MAG: preprotein translocase subunit SecA, partial [Myxococcota bacterium]|nr:preprotein translocase subunit SecA [Myxococcota bacterium]